MGGNCFSVPAMSDSTASSATAAAVTPASGSHSATVFFLHGLGDTGHGWAPVMNMIKDPHIKYVCPHAPIQPVTLNMGMQMPSWFDIRSLDASAAEDEAGIKAAAKSVQEMLKREEEAGTPSNRILIGGFSQGGALALYSAITYDKPLAGVIALSAWLPLHKEIEKFVQEGKSVNKETPILQGHGDADPLVQFAFGQQTSTYLSAFNPHHTFKTYPGMGHSSCDQEIKDIKEFVGKQLPKK